MTPQKPVHSEGTPEPGEEMVWSESQKSLIRGRRVAPRTEVCRPCLVWLQVAPELKLQGVLLDLNPHGMRVRLIERIPPGTPIVVQMMRDEKFEVPLSPPIESRVVRNETAFGGLVDHGVKRILKPIKRAESPRPVSMGQRRRGRRVRTRMHTLDMTLGNRGSSGYGRRRG
jgi:hypothetical protein